MGVFIIKEIEKKISELLYSFFNISENDSKRFIKIGIIRIPIILLGLNILQDIIAPIDLNIQQLNKIKDIIREFPVNTILSLYLLFLIVISIGLCSLSIGLYFFNLNKSFTDSKTTQKGYPIFVLSQYAIDVKEIDINLVDSKIFTKSAYRTKGVLQHREGKKEHIYICTAPKSDIKGTKVENIKEYSFLNLLLCNLGDLGLSLQISQIEIDGTTYFFHLPYEKELDIMSGKKQVINLEFREVITNESTCIDINQESSIKFESILIDFISKNIYGDSFIQRIKLKKISPKSVDYKSSEIKIFDGKIQTLK